MSTQGLKGIRGVLFDLDGTLLDTAPDMGATLNALLLEHGLPALAHATIRPHVREAREHSSRWGSGRRRPQSMRRASSASSRSTVSGWPSTRSRSKGYCRCWVAGVAGHPMGNRHQQARLAGAAIVADAGSARAR